MKTEIESKSTNRTIKQTVLLEVAIFGLLFLLSYLFNVVAMLQSDAAWGEALFHIKSPLILSVILYVCVGMFRLLVVFFGKSVKSFNKFSNPEQF